MSKSETIKFYDVNAQEYFESTVNINLDELSLMAFEDPSTGGNPKKINQKDLKEMYEKSISGNLF